MTSERLTRARRSRLRLVPLAVLAAALAVGGCRTVKEMTPSSRGAEEARTRLLQQQARNMRFADEYVGRLIGGTHRVDPAVTDARERLMLSGWLLQQANAAYVAAAGDNPTVGTLDLITLATLSRIVAEDTIVLRFPERGPGLLAAHRELEASAWRLAEGVLTAEQQASLGQLIVDWRKANPKVEDIGFVRFQSFVSVIQDSSGGTTAILPGGLMGLIGLDPLAGLDPAVRQVEQTRLLAERAIFYAERVPIVLDLQLDRSLNRMAAGPESRKLLEQGASLSSSAERFASSAETLPDAFAKEREALIRQLSDTLESQQATLRPMLVELRNALETGSTAATSVDQAVRSIEALVARFAKEPGAEPGKPFDVNEYARAAAELALAARELQQLLGSVGAQAPQLGTALDAGVAKGQSLIDYLFVRIAWLIVLLLAGILATLLLYRRLAPRTGTS